MLYLTGADNAPVREAASTYPIRGSGQGLLSPASLACRRRARGRMG